MVAIYSSVDSRDMAAQISPKGLRNAKVDGFLLRQSVDLRSFDQCKTLTVATDNFCICKRGKTSLLLVNGYVAEVSGSALEADGIRIGTGDSVDLVNGRLLRLHPNRSEGRFLSTGQCRRPSLFSLDNFLVEERYKNDQGDWLEEVITVVSSGSLVERVGVALNLPYDIAVLEWSENLLSPPEPGVTKDL
jgi:hypothetical protein